MHIKSTNQDDVSFMNNIELLCIIIRFIMHIKSINQVAVFNYE